MSDGLDVIILDDDPGICEIIAELIDSFYTWGKVYSFSNPLRPPRNTSTTKIATPISRFRQKFMASSGFEKLHTLPQE